MLLLRPPESVVDVVGDFGEAAQRGDVWVLFELLLETKWILDIDWRPLRNRDDRNQKDRNVYDGRGAYINEAKAVVIQKVLEGLRQSFVWTADQQAGFIIWRSDKTTLISEHFKGFTSSVNICSLPDAADINEVCSVEVQLEQRV